jgi:hypothetical protein
MSKNDGETAAPLAMPLQTEPPSQTISTEPTVSSHEVSSDNQNGATSPVVCSPRPGFLLVDDNKINLQVRIAGCIDATWLSERQILVAYMRKQNQPYKTAMDGLQALNAYMADPGRYRCILMGKYVYILWVLFRGETLTI